MRIVELSDNRGEDILNLKLVQEKYPGWEYWEPWQMLYAEYRDGRHRHGLNVSGGDTIE